MSSFENYEWTRLWCEKAKDSVRPRALLIGDSITEGYCNEVNLFMGNCAYVDSIVTSMAINNEAYTNCIKWFQGSYKKQYQAIHFNNGLHGFHVDIGQYKKALEKMVDFLRSSYIGAELILATSTPVYLAGTDRIIDKTKNGIVLERNEVVFEIAKEYHLLVDDLYGYTMGNSEWRADDGFHYNDIGRRKQADQVACILKRFLNVEK